MENTPGPGGYLLAWGVSAAFPGLVIAGAGLVAGQTSFVDAVSIGYLYSFFTMMASVPFACVGIPLVHLACRRVRCQAVHVLAAGLAGALPVVVLSLVVGRWIGLDDGLIFIPFATALGRLSVVPLVHRRRRQALMLSSRALAAR